MQNMIRNSLVVLGLLLGGVFIPPAKAQPTLESMAQLLTELPGWRAEKPDLMSMNQAGMNLAYAARRYE